ncbi:MAG: DUF2071 domain-containing protein [Bradymonadaceae bacterium]
MVWYDLLFAHWSVDPSLVVPHLPAGLELDLREGRAWLGVVPFGMTGVRMCTLLAASTCGRGFWSGSRFSS